MWKTHAYDKMNWTSLDGNNILANFKLSAAVVRNKSMDPNILRNM